MSLEKTIQELRDLLNRCSNDLEKTERGNKAAAQRVRTGTVKLEKTAKRFRKESVAEDKKGGFQKFKEAARRNKKAQKAAAAKASSSSTAHKTAKKKPAAKKKTVVKKKSAPKKKAAKSPKKPFALRRPVNKQSQKRISW